jgi:hypothetical protein
VSRIDSAQLEIPRDLQRLGWEIGIWNSLYIQCTMHHHQQLLQPLIPRPLAPDPTPTTRILRAQMTRDDVAVGIHIDPCLPPSLA